MTVFKSKRTWGESLAWLMPRFKDIPVSVPTIQGYHRVYFWRNWDSEMPWSLALKIGKIDTTMYARRICIRM